jgi:hypothetical protein
MIELRIEKEVVLKYPTRVHALLISLAGSENKYCHSILIGSKRLQCSRQQAASISKNIYRDNLETKTDS